MAETGGLSRVVFSPCCLVCTNLDPSFWRVVSHGCGFQPLGKTMALFSSQGPSGPQQLLVSPFHFPIQISSVAQGGGVFVEVRLVGGRQDITQLRSAMSVLENAGKHFMNPVLYFVIKHSEGCLLSSLCPSFRPSRKP